MTSLTTLPPSRSASPESVVDRLFARLHATYGRAWLDMWADADVPRVKATWAESLRNVTVEEMRLALAELDKRGGSFPPNLPEFSALCRQFKPRGTASLYLTDRSGFAGHAGGFQSLRAVLRKAQE